MAALGIERSQADRITGRFFQLGAGAGGIGFDDAGDRIDFGIGVTGQLGARIWNDPGPLGLLVGLRTSHVFTARSTGHVLALTFGLTAHPR